MGVETGNMKVADSHSNSTVTPLTPIVLSKHEPLNPNRGGQIGETLNAKGSDLGVKTGNVNVADSLSTDTVP